MNQIIPPPHEGTPAHEPPTDHTVRPTTLPAKRSNGRLILGIVVLLALAGALGFGFWQHYRVHAEVIATADQRRDFVPSVRTGTIHASEEFRSAIWPGTTEAFSWRSRRRRSNTRSRRPRARSPSCERTCSRRRPTAIWRR